MDDPDKPATFAEDIILLRWVGINVVVVHGGGPQIKEMLDRVGIPSRMAHGMRLTDAPTMQIVEMVLGGQVNKELVRLINQKGGAAVGLTGKDGRLALARRLEKLGPDGIDPGLVGEVVEVDVKVLHKLTADFVPVIAPIAVDAEGRTLNVNADPFAAKLAVAMSAEKLVLLTDVQGVKDAEGKMIPSLSSARAKELIAQKVISGGMIPKVEYALESLASGVRKVHIVDGRVEHALLLEIFTDKGVGTELTA
jgi:acetylglutamate kinase